MSLPEKGWQGYGRPGVPSPDLRQAAARMRALALSHDDQGHALREIAFRNWCRETVFPDSVCRLIHQIGESVK